jgi:hypothetical protein
MAFSGWFAVILLAIWLSGASSSGVILINDFNSDIETPFDISEYQKAPVVIIRENLIKIECLYKSEEEIAEEKKPINCKNLFNKGNKTYDITVQFSITGKSTQQNAISQVEQSQFRDDIFEKHLNTNKVNLRYLIERPLEHYYRANLTCNFTVSTENGTVSYIKIVQIRFTNDYLIFDNTQGPPMLPLLPHQPRYPRQLPSKIRLNISGNQYDLMIKWTLNKPTEKNVYPLCYFIVYQKNINPARAPAKAIARQNRPSRFEILWEDCFSTRSNFKQHITKGFSHFEQICEWGCLFRRRSYYSMKLIFQNKLGDTVESDVVKHYTG